MRPTPGFIGAGGYPVRHEPYYVTIPLSEWEDMTDELKRLREENARLRETINQDTENDNQQGVERCHT